MRPKVYTSSQRIKYGWGWFAISIILGFIFVSLDWVILAWLAFIFSGLSLVTAYFGKNDDSQNEMILICPKCQIGNSMYNLNNNPHSTLFIYNEDKPEVRKKDGLNIFPMICFECKKVIKWASDRDNYSGNATYGFEYFKSNKITKKDLNEAIDTAIKNNNKAGLNKLKKIKL